MIALKPLLVAIVLLASVLHASIAKAASACLPETTLFSIQYLGACGYQQSDKFTLMSSQYVTWVRIWYDTSKAANGLTATMTGPNGFSLSQVTTLGGCYSGWCEGKLIVNSILPAGTYNVSLDVSAECSNPSGASTLVVYGCSTYAISATASPAATGTVTCSPNPVSSGINSICTATANPGYVFSSWTGDCSGTTPTCTLSNVAAQKSVVAQFQPASNTSCAALSGSSLTLPCLGVGGSYFSAGLSLLQSSAVRFSVDTILPSAQNTSCADFNATTMLVRIPCVSYQGTNYQADLKLVGVSPLICELSGLAVQDSATKSLMVTGQDGAYSTATQKALAGKVRTLNAAAKQSIVAVNALLYTDYKNTSFADFQNRLSIANQALAMEISAATDLKTAAAAQTTSTKALRLTAERSLDTVMASKHPLDVGDGTLSLGVSTKADVLSSQLQAISDVTSTEAKRKQAELNQEVASVYAQQYANEASVSETLRRASVVIGSGAKVAGMVGGAALAIPAMAGASIPAFIPAFGSMVVGGVSTLVGLLDDRVVFSGGNGPLPSDSVPMLANANTFFGLLTLRADTAAETGLNVLNLVSGYIPDAVNAGISLDSSSNTATTTTSCSAAKRGMTIQAASCPAPSLSASVQLPAGNFRDPVSGTAIVSTGLDSEWETTIRGLGGQVLFAPPVPSPYDFNRADLVFTGFVPRYRNTLTGTIYRDGAATCSYGTLSGSMSGNTFSGSYNSSNGAIAQTGSATISGDARTIAFDVRVSGATGGTNCSYSVASFPLTYIYQLRGWGDVSGQDACNLVANLSYSSSYSTLANVVYDGMDCSNALLSVIMKTE